jgi:two-component system sensor histidine kinase RpfC
LVACHLRRRIVVSGILERAGHQVVRQTDPELALDMLLSDDKGIEMAPVDLNMPELGGIELIRAYRFIQHQDGLIPIGVLTADATEKASTDSREVVAKAGSD